MKEQKETIAGKERASSGKKGRASRPHPANGLVRNETDFENPGTLAPPEAEVTLAGGQKVSEKLFTIDFPFDGGIRTVRVSFAPIQELLIGTEMLAGYRLEIDFVARTVWLDEVIGP